MAASHNQKLWLKIAAGGLALWIGGVYYRHCKYVNTEWSPISSHLCPHAREPISGYRQPARFCHSSIQDSKVYEPYHSFHSYQCCYPNENCHVAGNPYHHDFNRHTYPGGRLFRRIPHSGEIREVVIHHEIEEPENSSCNSTILEE